MISIFWMSFLGVFYAYFGYPIVLIILGLLKDILFPEENEYFTVENAPSVTIIIPVHNEKDIIGDKIQNTIELYYPGKLQVLIISDGSTDGTPDIIRQSNFHSRIVLIEQSKRKGKAHALNMALQQAKGEVIVFSDASIMLDQQAIWNIVQPFTNKKIGCVSGEDLIEGGGGEGLYGKYELFLRKQESRLGSIVGASGSFYAQRKSLVNLFSEGLAPDFLSVMNTVEQGYKVISHPPAYGFMSALESSKDEFQRKVRTLIRGMTALFIKKQLLNPLRYPLFSFFLWSHKIMRWLVPFFLLGLVGSSALLIGNIFFNVMFCLQVLFYLLALICHLGIGKLENTVVGKIALFFTIVNIAILYAWLRYLFGFRQEVWTPTKRS